MPTHSILLRGANHLSDGLTSPMTSTQAEREAAQHRNLTLCPFYRSPTSFRCVACVRSRHQLDLYRIMPRSCISARSPADYCANYGAQLFHPVEVSISQARSRMQCHEGMHLLEQGSDSFLGTNVCCPLVGQTPPIILAIRALSLYVLAHGTPANPCMKRQTYYVIIIDICSLRLIADWREKLTESERF
jgi:hypothetical protein